MLYNLKRCYTATIGTGTLTIGAAILNDFSDIPDGTTVSYSIMQGSLSAGFDAEVGRGTYSAGTLARDTVLSSTSGGVKIALDGTAQVVVTALAEDFVSFSGGVAGQVAAWSSTDTITAGALIPPASNILTLTNAAASTLALNITAAKTLTLTAADNANLVIPGAGGTAALLATANAFTNANTITVATTTATGLSLKTTDNNTTKNLYEARTSADVLKFAVSALGNVMIGGAFWPSGGSNTPLTVANIPTSSSQPATVIGTRVSGDYQGIHAALFTITNTTGNNTQTITDDFPSSFLAASNFGPSVNSMVNFAAFRTTGSMGAVTLTNFYSSFLGQMVVSSGTLTNQYALYINDITSAATLNVAIRTGKGQINLGDRVFITGWQDVNQLKVTGFTTQTNPVAYLIDNTSATNTVRNVLQLETQSTGTAANGFGAGLLFTIETATAATIQSAGRVYTVTIDASNASRKYALVGTAFDTAEREGWRVEADGSAAKVGLYGAATVVRATTSGTASTFAANTSGIADDTATFDGYTIGQVVKALRDIGILT